MKKFIGSIAVSVALCAATIVQASESFGGLGISVYTGKNGVSIAAVLPNSPASMVGLQAGDFIASVNGTPLSSVAPENQVSLLRGTSGTSLELLVQRKGEEITISAKRADISVQDFDVQEISAWYGKSKDLTAEEINYLAAQKVGEDYKLLGVMQNGIPINPEAEKLDPQGMQHISVKKEAENINAPSLPKAGALKLANREMISLNINSAASTARISILTVKGTTVWQKDLNGIPAGANNFYWNGANLPSGSYHVKLEAGSMVSVYKFNLK